MNVKRNLTNMENKMTKKDAQIVVRITNDVDKKIKKEAEKVGLTKASWVRKLIIQTLFQRG
jgi:predicted DNA binding CopG/RHH family protein